MKYRHVFFDVDSTLVTIEGIDVLGAAYPEVAALTKAAMEGEITLTDVYAKRLELIRPTRGDVETLSRRYLTSMVEGAETTVRTLLDRGMVVHLVTAGIEQAVLPLAERLSIPAQRVHAVRLRFHRDGSYDNFDHRSLLARAGGKELVIRDVRARSHGKAAMIGDGVSDLEAKPAVDLFIGYGGVVVRKKVKENAAVFVTRLADVLPHLT